MNVRTRRIYLCVFVLLVGVLYFFLRRSSYTEPHVIKIVKPDLKSYSKDVVSLKMLLIAAIKAAQLGGYQVVSVHDQITFDIESKGKTKEGENDPVTAADYKSHCAMYKSLTEAFPGITVISEEESKDCDKVIMPDLTNSFSNFEEYDIDEVFENIKDITIWIDPLDATKEFTENLLHYVTTMVCIAVNGVPTIGVIYKPFEARKDHSLYWTWVGYGVSKNLQNLPMLETTELPIVIVSRSHAGQVSDAVEAAFGKNVQIVSAAGAGYKFLELAVGNVSAYVHTTAIKKWDICSGTTIIKALGGRTTSLFDGKNINFDPDGSKVLTSGLLSTRADHFWYLKKFSKKIGSLLTRWMRTVPENNGLE